MILGKEKLDVLIVEDQDHFRALYSLILAEEADLSPVTASNDDQALDILLKNSQFDLIISDSDFKKESGKTIFFKAQELEIPFLLVTKSSIGNFDFIKEKPLTSFVRKPFSEAEFRDSVRQLFNEKRQYISVPLDLLFKLGELPVPIFVRLPSKKVLKVFNQGDVFSQYFYDRWIARNVFSLLVLKQDFDLLVKDFKSNVLSEMFFTSLDYAGNKPIILSGQILETLLNAAKSLGVTDSVVEMNRKNVQLVLNIMNSRPDLKRLLKNHNFSSPSGIYVRSHLTSLLSSWLAAELDMKHHRIFEILTMASFFHDIGLDDEIVLNESHFIESARVGVRMNKSEVEMVKNHIEVALAFLKQFNGCPPEVLDIVKQHHEKPDGSGYPKGLKAQDLSPQSAVFILAHEFVEMFFDTNRKTQLKESWLELKKDFFYEGVFSKGYQIFLDRLN
jgi:response regulator RpfG family c-di-GMP phosphodiesterase